MLVGPRARFYGALLFGLLCFSGPADAHATPVADADTLLQTWASWQPLMRLQARIPVHLDARDFERLARGDIARHRTQLQGIDRVVGATWSALPRDALWIAIIDDAHDTLVDGLTEIHLSPSQAHQKLLFQHIDLPWPFTDRQWVIDIRNNARLAASSHNAIWERTWMLCDEQTRLAQQISRTDMPADDAIWTPLNEGGWLLVQAGGGTLLVYHGRADLGGSIPNDITTAYALSTLKSMLTHIINRAQEIPSHYDQAHVPILRPDDSAIPAW